jgi:hypothetical protein
LDATVVDLGQSEFADQWIAGGWAETLPPEVIRALLDRPEALVYQFIVTAVPANGAGGCGRVSVPAEAAAAAQATLAARLAARMPAVTTLRCPWPSSPMRPDLSVLTAMLESLGRALRHASERKLLDRAQLILVDNGPGSGWRESLTTVVGRGGFAGDGRIAERAGQCRLWRRTQPGVVIRASANFT